MELKKVWSKFLEYYFVFVSFIAGSLILVFEFLRLNRLYSTIIGIFALLMIIFKDIKDKHKINEEVAERKLTDEKIDKINESVSIKNVELEHKKKVISEFLRLGIIKEDDIISSLNQEPFIVLFHFNRKLREDIEPFLHENKKAIKHVLERLNFVPVGAYTGSYFFHVVGANSLPKPLDNINYLGAYIKKEVRKLWKITWNNMEKENQELYLKYEDEKDKRTNLSYFLGKIFPSNLSIGYLNFSTFDKDFLSYYIRFTNSKKVKVDSKKLNDLLSLASIEFFMQSIEPIDKKIILENEDKIKKGLGISSLIDYQGIGKEALEKELEFIFKNSKEKSTKYSEEIILSIEQDLPIIKEFL